MPTFYQDGHRKGAPKGAIKDLRGKRFGRLIVREYLYIKGCHTYWLCDCDCGNQKVTSSHSLQSGDTVSCGCYHREQASGMNITHGYTNTEHRLASIYKGMHQRCYNTKATNYEEYGGRGIYICDEWKRDGTVNGINNFVKWAYENGYHDPLPGEPRSKWLTIDRIDVNGPYAPWNCRWATNAVQGHNMRFNRYIYDGEEWLIFKDFDRKYGIEGRSYILDKLRAGWNPSEIVYAAKHPELRLRKQPDQDIRRDKDGFIRLIRNIPDIRILSHDEYEKLMKKEKG